MTTTFKQRNLWPIALLTILTTSLIIALVVAPTWGWLLLLPLLAMFALRLLAHPTPAATRPRPTVRPLLEQRVVLSYNDTPRAAMVIPVAHETNHELVLTSEGYALVNAEGKMIYRLRKPLS
jgi:hypothetical protein